MQTRSKECESSLKSAFFCLFIRPLRCSFNGLLFLAQNGRLEYFGGVRHKEVEECAVGAIAMLRPFTSLHRVSNLTSPLEKRGA
jgi:hypothetical protein